MADRRNVRLFYFYMDPLFSGMWFFKLRIEPNPLFSCHAPTENAGFDNGRVNCRFSELDWNQTNAIIVRHD